MTSFTEITGVVDRAQNPDALLTDGARALTGNLSVADGITIDGVDISAFQSAYQAHLANPVAHSYVRNILDDASAAVDRDALTNDVRIYGADGISVTKTSSGLRISGSGGGGGSTFAGIKAPSGAAAVPDGFNYISLTASNQVSITASTNALAFALVPGNIDHQDLGGRGADDHHAGFVGLKVGATTVNPDGSDVITIAAGTNATVVAGSNTVTIGVSSTPAFNSVTVSGNISVSGTVDGVDISTHAANANAHHNQSHVLATNAGLGADHTMSGATAGHVLRASSATAAAFAAIQDGDLPSTIVRTSRQIVSGNGLTGGGNLSADRTLAVNQDYDFSWTGLHTFGDHTEMESVDINGALTVHDDLSVFHGGYYPLFVNVDTVNPNNSNVGIMTNSPDPQFALDVAGPLRAQYLIGPHAIQLSDAAMICHFDGPYPFETNFDGFAAGHLGQVATETGGVIYRPGKFGKAVQTAEATTNLVTNPSFEVNTTGWSALNTATLTRVSTDAYVGDYSLKVDVASLSNGARFPITLSPSTAYTLTLWLKSSTASAQLDIQLFNVTGAANVGRLSSQSITNEWQKFTLSFTTPITVTSYEIRLFTTTGAPATQTFFVDAVQLEQKAYATPYCDGSLGGGHTWAGTAHASTSSRTATTVSYSGVGVDADAMTLMAWIYPTSAGSYQVIASQTNGGFTEGWELANSSGTARVTLRNPTANITAGALTLNAWNHIAATYDRTTLRLYLNGVETGNTAATQSVATTNALALGYRPGGATFNGLIDDFVILSRAAPADEIRSIYESDAPVFAESSIEVWRTPTAIPIWVDSEGLWMRAVGGGETLGAYGGDATKSWGGKTLYQSDFLLGNATDGYIHWHAFQDDGDPWGAAGMEVKAQVDIVGASTVTGALNVAGEFAVTNGGTPRLLVTTNSLLAGTNAGTDSSSFALVFVDDMIIGSDPGGSLYDTGDLVIGDELNSNLFWDQSAGRFNFRDGSTVRAYVDADGRIKAGNGAVILDEGGFYLAVGTGTPNRIRWMNSATERSSINGFDSGGIATVSILAGQNAATAYPGTVSLTASEGSGSLGFASLSLDGPGNQAVVQFDDNDGRFKVQRTGPTVWFEVGPTDTRLGGSLTLPEMSSTPATPTSGTQMRAYMKADKLVFQYNDGGTVRYKYLDLTGTGVTWVHTTTAP